jgi:hypothetical protein
MAQDEFLTAVVREQRRRSRRWLVAIAALVVLGLVIYSLYRQQDRVDIPVDYSSDTDHFKYGSIGSDDRGLGIPYWVWKTMPDVCKGQLPGGYASLGVIQEPGKSTPIGFSMRKVGFVDQVGPNCGLCHTGTVRETPSSKPMIYPTAPAHQLNLMGYFRFLFACGRDPNFTADNFIPAIKRYKDVSLAEQMIYRVAVPRIRDALMEKAPKFDAIVANRPSWGPGRVDTFNPYKVLMFNLDMSNDTSIGTADFMSIWNQSVREGIWLHWDGNNDSVDERNLSAALGAGASPDSVDLDRIMRIKKWILEKAPPPYPFKIDYGLAAIGKPIYDQHCASCHDVKGAQFGQVTPLNRIGTDPQRHDAFDAAMAERMNTIGHAEGKPWAFKRFNTTNGYANHPLDAIWLRAPYLHNGSVPTLRALLSPPDQRPKTFYQGDDVYDQGDLGFRNTVPEQDGRVFFLFDTTLPGNGNGGHVYGADLGEAEKNALLEYLKTL